jgi:hypothetical protein
MGRRSHLSWLAASGVGAALVTLVGTSRAADVELIKTAVEVLRAAPTDSARALRRWSVDVVNHYSKVKFDSAQRAALIDSVRLPGMATIPRRAYSRRAIILGISRS